jgi:hypothetical protein
MNKPLLAGAMACAVLALVGTASTVSAAPKGNAWGYWAGRLCDHVGPTTDGTTYWQSRHYVDRGTCVELEGQPLRAASGTRLPGRSDPQNIEGRSSEGGRLFDS